MAARTISIAQAANGSRNGPVAEIRLAGASPPAGFLNRRGRKFRELVHGRPVTAGTLLVTTDALVVDARAEFRGRVEIPWDSIRKAVVDDGGRWGYVSEVCRFPVYADRPDGSGPGTLIGPLWSQASSLMPPECPVPALDPVPARAPNMALIFDPAVVTPTPREQSGHRSFGSQPIVGLLCCVEDPDVAREALGSMLTIGDLDHGDLEYLIRIAPGDSGNGEAENSASGDELRRIGGNGASASAAAS